MTTCECGQGEDYRRCCRPVHRGDEEADTPARLVGARFCAFARKDVDYLWRTLHPVHEDRRRPESELKLDLRRCAQAFRYARLHLLDARDDEVLFLAELYASGKEHSFVERSRFAVADGGWRYLCGSNTQARAAQAAQWRFEALPPPADPRMKPEEG